MSVALRLEARFRWARSPTCCCGSWKPRPTWCLTMSWSFDLGWKVGKPGDDQSADQAAARRPLGRSISSPLCRSSSRPGLPTGGASRTAAERITSPRSAQMGHPGRRCDLCRLAAAIVFWIVKRDGRGAREYFGRSTSLRGPESGAGSAILCGWDRRGDPQSALQSHDASGHRADVVIRLREVRRRTSGGLPKGLA